MCLYVWNVQMCESKSLLSLHISGWLAPRGVSLISRIRGLCSSHRIRLRGSVAFFPPYPPFFKVSSSSPSLFLSLHLSLVSLLPRCHTGSPSLTSCQGTYIRVHPEICWRDLNKVWFIPRWLHFHFFFSHCEIFGALMPISIGFMPSPDKNLVIREIIR